MRKIAKIFLFIITFLALAILSREAVFAIGPKKLGEQCASTSECGINMGCRQSAVGVGKVCKIAVPGTVGCAVEKEEPLCGEGMLCKENRCVNDFGLEKGENLQKKPSEVQSSNFTFFLKNTFSPIVSFFGDERFKNALGIIFASGLLFGLTWVLRGFLIYQNATGLIPEQKRGIYSAGLGGAVFAVSIFLWYLLR